MPRRPPRPAPTRRRLAPHPGSRPRAKPSRALVAGLIGGILVMGLVAGFGTWTALRNSPARTMAEARAATEARDWPRALAAWHTWNETGTSTPATLLIEAQLAADLGQSRRAATLAERVTRLDPGNEAAWTVRLNRLRVLDRPDEARQLGLAALGKLSTPAARRQVLKATTLATLADLPDAEARDQLDRWIAADPADIDAQVARLARIAANPHPDDPDRATRIADLTRIVAANPRSVAAREALTIALADAGEVDRGRTLLAGWAAQISAAGPAAGDTPETRYNRLQARWDLEYDHNPARAARAFGDVLIQTPHDWKAHAGLSRALRALGRTDDARAEALAVARLRERLDPATLGPRLTAAFTQIDAGTPAEATAAMIDLSHLCQSVGLLDLAAAWSRLTPR